MCAATGFASFPRCRLYADPVPPELQPIFTPWRRVMAAPPAKPQLVYALDYRGHGQSEYDRNPDNYTLPVATNTTR
jgi:pimeloyl-ACP methyl ester carboxylesterase